MNGELLFEKKPLFLWSDLSFTPDACKYEHLPVLCTPEEVAEKDFSSDEDICNVNTLALNEFLLNRFGYGLHDFMKLYSKLHFLTLLKQEFEGFALPVSEKSICYFGVFDNPVELAKKLKDYQATISTDFLGQAPLNLHDNSIYKFTLIRANFDINANKDLFYFCYFYEIDKFRLLIKSSAQFDLTLVYEEL